MNKTLIDYCKSPVFHSTVGAGGKKRLLKEKKRKDRFDFIFP